jgi:hypothetical protein
LRWDEGAAGIVATVPPSIEKNRTIDQRTGAYARAAAICFGCLTSALLYLAVQHTTGQLLNILKAKKSKESPSN